MEFIGQGIDSDDGSEQDEIGKWFAVIKGTLFGTPCIDFENQQTRVRANENTMIMVSEFSQQTYSSPMAPSTTASQEELKANGVPLGWRDSCSAYVDI